MSEDISPTGFGLKPVKGGPWFRECKPCDDALFIDEPIFMPPYDLASERRVINQFYIDNGFSEPLWLNIHIPCKGEPK